MSHAGGNELKPELETLILNPLNFKTSGPGANCQALASNVRVGTPL